MILPATQDCFYNLFLQFSFIPIICSNPRFIKSCFTFLFYSIYFNQIMSFLSAYLIFQLLILISRVLIHQHFFHFLTMPSLIHFRFAFSSNLKVLLIILLSCLQVQILVSRIHFYSIFHFDLLFFLIHFYFSERFNQFFPLIIPYLIIVTKLLIFDFQLLVCIYFQVTSYLYSFKTMILLIQKLFLRGLLFSFQSDLSIFIFLDHFCRSIIKEFLFHVYNLCFIILNYFFLLFSIHFRVITKDFNFSNYLINATIFLKNLLMYFPIIIIFLF